MSLVPWWWKLLGAVALVGALIVLKNAYDDQLVAKGDAAGAERVQGRWDKAEAAIKWTPSGWRTPTLPAPVQRQRHSN
jgi:hypothetical protein